MGKAEKAKGYRGECEVRDILKAAGYGDAKRTPYSGALYWKGDIMDALPGFCIEVKRAERLQIPQWIRQTEEQAPEGDAPLLVFRQSNQPWRCVIDFDRFIELVGKANAD